MVRISNLNVANWNCNGLRYKIAELIQFAREHNVHVLSITETRLNPKVKPYLPGFEVFRADGSPPQRGVLLAIKKELLPERVSLVKAPINMEVVAAQINSVGGKIVFAAVYNSPSRLRFLQNNEVEDLFKLGTRVVVMGDLNSRHSFWNCRSSNKNGRTLFNYCTNHNIRIVFPREPTHFPNSSRASPSTLDLSLIKGFPNLSLEANSLHALSSDHNPVILKLDLSCNTRPQTQWDLGKADWRKFREIICDRMTIPDSIVNHVQLDKHVEELTQLIRDAANASVPRRTVLSSGDQIPNELKQLILKKNQVRKRWNRNRSPLAKKLYNQWNGIVRVAVAKWRQKVWISKIKNLSARDGSVWRFLKRIKGQKSVIGPLKSSCGLSYSPCVQAELLAANYEGQFTNKMPIPSDEVFARNLEEIPRTELESVVLKSIKPKDVKFAIKMVKKKKAPGFDGILPIFVHNLPGKAIIYLCRIFESMLGLRYFPIPWKKAEIIPVFKPGKDPQLAVNYRPISLLPILGKLAERFILNWLELEVNRRSLLPSWQFGFRKSHSAMHQVARVVNYTRDKGRWPVALVLLDVAKAFDSVWHQGLISKLQQYGLPTQLCEIIKDFLSNRQFRVRVANEKSTWRPVRAGVPQGALISPLLYTLYTADIQKPRFAELAQFADDTALVYSHRDFRCVSKRLERELEDISEYYAKWRLSLNKEKTEAIMLSSRMRHTRRPIKFGSGHLEWSSSVRYLGVNLDRRLNFGGHLRKAAASAKTASRLLWPLINPRSQLPLEDKLNVYKAMVRPRLSYGVPVWWGRAAKSNLALLERVENKTLRLIANPPPGINNDIIRVGLDMSWLREFLESSVKKFYLKCSSNENVHIANLRARIAP